jgi:hypothetical protein
MDRNGKKTRVSDHDLIKGLRRRITAQDRCRIL